MMPTELPQGRYLSLAFRVSAGGRRPDARAADAQPHPRDRGRRAAGRAHARPRDRLPAAARAAARAGPAVDGMRLLNIYEHYREHGWGDDAADRRDARGPERAPGARGRRRRRQRLPADPQAARRAAPDDRLRARATARRTCGCPRSASTTSRGGAGGSSWSARAARSSASTRRPGSGSGAGSATWSGDERTFVFIDSRFVVPHVVPMRGRRFHLIYQMHNIHVRPPHRWDSPMSPRLQARARADRRHGRDGHADRAPARRHRRALRADDQPVRRPEPGRAARAAAGRGASATRTRSTIVARLEGQKRLTHAIEAFERVVAEVPAARLDIYGDGSQRERLQAEIDRRGLGDVGHAARLRPAGARRALDVERVPDDELVRGLSAVDAREHGPRLPGGQLRHQVRAARADHRRRRRLPRARRRHGAARAARGRAAALARAGRADERGRARDAPSASGRPSASRAGREVLEQVVERKRQRTRIDAVELDLHAPARGARQPARAARAARAGLRARPGRLEPRRRARRHAARRGREPQDEARRVEFELAWVLVETGEVVERRSTAKRDEETDGSRCARSRGCRMRTRGCGCG